MIWIEQNPRNSLKSKLKAIRSTIKIAFLSIVIFCATGTFAQNEVDALRYSLRETPMTARSLGCGGAFGALGADLSSFFHNPAGIGLFKRGGIELSLGLTDQSARSTYMSNDATNARTHVTLNNIGLIGAQDTGNSEWPAFNFGVAYAKTNNFYENFSIKGTSESSLLLPFSIQANGTLPTELYDNFPFASGIALDAGLILPTDSTGQQYEPQSSGTINQSKSVTRSGSQGETAFGFGTNYRNFLFFGMTINFQSIRFIEKSTYTENFEDTQTFGSFQYDENLRSDGTGVNAKLGFLVKPLPWLRAGAAYHTPSRITLHETYSTTIQGNRRLGSGSEEAYTSPDLITDYSMRTPGVLLTNVAFILKKSGAVSVDYEYTNFENITMRGSATNDYNYSAENNTIKSIYKSTHKFRAGIEMRLLGTYYLRAGAIYQQSPLVDNVGAINNPLITYTGGIGFRNDHYIMDLGIGYTTKTSTYYLYDPRFVQAASIHSTHTSGLLSLGYRF